jgi:hypothetical protein
MIRASGRMLEVKNGTHIKLDYLDIKKGDRVVIWVNGIDTDDQKFVNTISHLNDFLNTNNSDVSTDFKIAGYHRDTIGRADKVQAGLELIHSRQDRIPRISRAIAKDLSEYIEQIIRQGASVVVLAHSAGNLISSMAYLHIDPQHRDKIGFIGIGDPHGDHNSPMYIGIMNEDDPMQKFADKRAEFIIAPSPLNNPSNKKEHHYSRTAYLVNDSIIGGAIKKVIVDLFKIIEDI